MSLLGLGLGLGGERLQVAQPSSLDEFRESIAEVRQVSSGEPLGEFVVAEGACDRHASDGELAGEEALEELLGVTEHEEAAVAAVFLNGDLGLDQGELPGGDRRGLRLTRASLPLGFPLELQIDPNEKILDGDHSCLGRT